jgi:hypothetical protein
VTNAGRWSRIAAVRHESLPSVANCCGSSRIAAVRREIERSLTNRRQPPAVEIRDESASFVTSGSDS